VPIFFIVLGAAAVLGIITTFLIYRKIHRADHLTFAIASIGVGIFFQNIVRMICPDPQKYPDVFGEKVFSFSNIYVSKQYSWILGITLVLILFLQLFFYKTKFGKAMRLSPSGDSQPLELMFSKQFTLLWWFLVGAVGYVDRPCIFSFDMGVAGLRRLPLRSGDHSVGTDQGFILGIAEI
jgi:hypothetical protein